MSISLLKFRKHSCFLLLQLLCYLVYILSILVSFTNTSVVQIRSTFIVLIFSYVSIEFRTFFHLVKFLSISLLVLSHFNLILMNILPYFILKLFNLGPGLSISLLNIKLVMIDIILCLCSMLIEPFPIALFFFLHLLIHLLFHQKLLLFLLVHLCNEFCLSLSFSDSFLCSFFLFGELNQPGL